MQLDVRNYLKKLKNTDDIKKLEKELQDLIKYHKDHPDGKANQIVQWFAIDRNKLNHS